MQQITPTKVCCECRRKAAWDYSKRGLCWWCEKRPPIPVKKPDSKAA